MNRRTRRRPLPLDVNAFEAGTRSETLVDLFEDGTGHPVRVPFVVVRGAEPGPTLGLTAAVHGDELNGIQVIHGLLADLDPSGLRGSLVCCPIVNVPAYLRGHRRFADGTDLNHSFPGRWNGRTSQQYAKWFGSVFLPPLDVLVDLHTASEGRVNSFYVRADLNDARVMRLALLMGPDIVLHAKGGDGTLRHAARRHGAAAITAEVGNPRTIQRTMVGHATAGLQNLMRGLGMVDGPVSWDDPPLLCESSDWLYTTTGGFLTPMFGLLDHVEKGQLLATTRDVFGRVTAEYKAPRDGVVIGMARNPVAVPGTRYIHLGRVGPPAPERSAEDDT